MTRFGKKRRRVVFFGLGSIGRRLARLTAEKGRHEVYAFRSGRAGASLPGVADIRSEAELDAIAPEVAFITNPTALHVETALACARRGMHLFIEKPLSDSLEGVTPLLRAVERRGLATYVGCNLRFDPMLRALKSRIEGRAPFFARVICSSHLPSWRPAQDYRRSYSASRAMGGGVLLDLIHEPDYCHWLFGPINTVGGEASRASALKIETEDCADLVLKHRSGLRSQVHLDYFGLRTQRQIEVFGDDIYASADLIGRTLLWIENGRQRVTSFEAPGRDDMYRAELSYFFRCLERGETPMNGLREHLQVLKPVLAFRRRRGLERIGS